MKKNDIVKPEKTKKKEVAIEAPVEAVADAPKKAKVVVEVEPKKKVLKKGKSKQRGKKYAEAKKSLDKTKSHAIAVAVKEIKKVKFANFTESVELHVKLGIDPKNTDQRVRFTTSLPFGTGKSVKILVISNETAREEKSVIYRNANAIEDILGGKLSAGKDFDIVITTPEFMKDIAKVARVLGPKGLMPNPKNNTVTNDIAKTVADLSKGQIELKNQSGHAVLHMIVGNVSFKDNELEDNINHILTELNKNIPAKLKKKFIQNAYIATTMSPSVRLEI